MSEENETSAGLQLQTKEVLSRYLQGFPLIFVQSDGVIQEINPLATALLGYDSVEYNGENVERFFQFLGIPLFSYRETTIFEALVTRKNSSVFPAQVHVIPFEENRSMLILNDLSIRNRLREQLFKEKHLLSTLIDAIQDHVFMIDTEGHYVLNNQSHLDFLGRKSKGEVIGKGPEDFFQPEISKLFNEDNQLVLKGIQGEVDRTVEFTQGKWYEIKRTAIRDPLTKEITGVVGLTRDVSERVNTEEKFRQVQRLESLGLLAGGIAHDFNNLLTVVVGLSDTASLLVKEFHTGKPIKEEEIRELSETLLEIRHAGQRAAVLTQKLLAVGRKQLVEMKNISLNEVIREMGSVLGGVLKSIEKPTVMIRLDYRLENDLPEIFVDRSQMEQVLLNLVVNARDAIHKRVDDFPQTIFQPIILLKTAYDAAENKVSLEIRDNGCGMSEEIQAKVFDPFFTTKEIGRGTGLGLASVYGILQQSRATVRIESEVGAGTLFRMEFQKWEPDQTKTKEQTSSIHLSQKNKKILYAEDDGVIRTLVRRNLQMQGYEVFDIDNGEGAWERYQQSPFEFSIVLTDLIMPKLSGIEFAKRILELNPQQKILCVSGYTNEETMGLPVLSKPFTIQKLLQRIKEIA